jgi:hypothetical protein
MKFCQNFSKFTEFFLSVNHVFMRAKILFDNFTGLFSLSSYIIILVLLAKRIGFDITFTVGGGH